MGATQGKNTPVKILIVDDHPVIRHGLAQLIAREADLSVSGLAGTAKEAWSSLEACEPDLAIVDISLNGVDGIDLIKQIKAQHDSIRMLVYSMHDEVLYADRAWVQPMDLHGFYPASRSSQKSSHSSLRITTRKAVTCGMWARRHWAPGTPRRCLTRCLHVPSTAPDPIGQPAAR